MLLNQLSTVSTSFTTIHACFSVIPLVISTRRRRCADRRANLVTLVRSSTGKEQRGRKRLFIRVLRFLATGIHVVVSFFFFLGYYALIVGSVLLSVSFNYVNGVIYIYTYLIYIYILIFHVFQIIICRN